MKNPHFEQHKCQMVAHGSNGRSLVLHEDGELYVVDTASTHRGMLTNMVNVCSSNREHFTATIAKGVDTVISCVDWN
jgi:hypothetical protein